MAGRGVLFAIDEQTVQTLIALTPSTERVRFVCEEIEEDFFDNKSNYLAETDKAWDAIHRSLTDGQLYWENGEYPLNHVILGGNLLYGGEEYEDDYIIILKTPEQVHDIAEALAGVTEKNFTEGYAQIDMEDYEYHLGMEDLKYSWQWLERIKPFWQKAAQENLAVIFTVAV